MTRLLRRYRQDDPAQIDKAAACPPRIDQRSNIGLEEPVYRGFAGDHGHRAISDIRTSPPNALAFCLYSDELANTITHANEGWFALRDENGGSRGEFGRFSGLPDTKSRLPGI